MIRSILAGSSRIRILNLREIRTHPMRMFTSLSVVVVSSALLIAVLGTYGSLTESVRQFNASITGNAQIEVAAIADSGVDAALAGELRAGLPDAQAVVPMIRGNVRIENGAPAEDGDTESYVPLIGSDFRVTSLSDDLKAAVAAGTGGAGTGIEQSALADGVIAGAGAGVAEGQRIDVNGVPVRVLTVLDAEQSGQLNGGKFLFAYLDLAQRITGREGTDGQPGRVDSILIVAEPGADVAALKARVAEAVGGRAVVVDPDFRAEQAEVASSVTRDATLLVSLISLVIAAFLMFNTMNMAVASRRRSMAMLRALGARRGHLVGDLLGEAAVFGFVGGLIGIPLGILAGRWAISSVPEGTSTEATGAVGYHLPLYAPVLAVIACIVACVAATTLAARSVFSVSPVEAMVPGEVTDSATRGGPAVWLAGIGGLVLAGTSYFVATEVPGRPAILAGAVYAVGVLLFCFAISAGLVRLVVWVSRRFGGAGQLAAVNTERSPRRAWATLMTVAVAIAVGMGTSGALNNLIGSMSDSMDGLGDPDFYVSATQNGEIPTAPLLDPALADAVRAVPGVEQVVGAQWATVNVGDAQVLVQGLTPRSQAPFMKKSSPEVLREMLAGNGMILSNVMARTLDVEVGDTLRLATPTGYHDIRVLDTVDYVTIYSGTSAMSLDKLEEWFGRDGYTYLQVGLTPDADPATVRELLWDVAAAHPSAGGRPVDVHSGAQALAATESQVEQSGAFTIAIQWIVAGAAAIALLNTLLLSVIERRRELGVLRAMGASRRFVSRMVLAEAASVAIVGSLVGVVLGGLLHWLSDQILAATTSVEIAYSAQLSTLVFVVAACALCLAGAFIPAARAARMNISEAILTE